MTLFFQCHSLTKAFGPRLLFQDLSLSLFSEDRIGLIGPNGSGKSTLLKILSGLENPTTGSLSLKRGLRIGYVPQSCDFPDKSPKAILLEALGNSGPDQDYEKELLVSTWLSKLGFTGEETSAARLSGGWKKRLSLAKELIFSPDTLLLDEPTNHLDLEGILWIEKLLLKETTSYLLVSHDRYFLQNMVNRVVEINPLYPNGLFSISGSYTHFLEKKEEFIKGQLEQERSVASKARRELAWLRQSPKARTTKAQSRVDNAHETLQELAEIKARNLQKRTAIDFAASERQTKKLLVAKNISKALGGKQLFHHLDLTLSPGMRIGLMGPNGSGKTTLLRILSGDLQPDQGTIKKAENLQIVYFDQHREQLSLKLTLRQALCPQGEFVNFRGQKIHVNGWCKRFLFSPDLLDMPLAKLSGGERARITIAHLMLQPANLLLLDEPTNDLDIPSLEALEESLLEFPGAVVLITHDRCMMDRICNSLLSLGDIAQNQLFADYSQWEAAQKRALPEQTNLQAPSVPLQKVIKLTYAEKKEYAQIEEKILDLEKKIEQLHQELQEPQLAHKPELLQILCSQVSLEETRLEQLYLRWDHLEKKQNGLA
jgi:ATP-binding cassette subfamily F protein uup